MMYYENVCIIEQIRFAIVSMGTGPLGRYVAKLVLACYFVEQANGPEQFRHITDGQGSLFLVCNVACGAYLDISFSMIREVEKSASPNYPSPCVDSFNGVLTMYFFVLFSI